MSKNDLRSAEIIPVKRELNHHEIYESLYTRIYVATLEPGQETQFHSHNVDTLYIAIKGGKIQTLRHPLDEGCPNIVVKKYSLIYKIQLLLEKIRKKPLTLVDGFIFFMPSGRKKVVHKAIASIDNNQAMVLLGIEIK